MDRFKPKASPLEVARAHLARGDFAAALPALLGAQRQRPGSAAPLRELHARLLEDARSGDAAVFAAARAAAEGHLKAVLELLGAASARERAREVRGLRHAYQQLLLPAEASRLSEALLGRTPGAKPVDEAEALLEAGRLTEAAERYAALLAAEPGDTHYAAQLARVREDLQGERDRQELVQALRAGGGAEHWALSGAGIFTEVPRRRVDELSYADFYENFTLRRRPVILTGVDAYRGFGWDEVSRLCGNSTMQLRAPVVSNSSVAWAGIRPLPGRVRLADWIARVRQPSDGTALSFVFDAGLADREAGCHRLLEALPILRYFANDVFKRLPDPELRRALDPFARSPGLFAQPAGSSSALHVDALDSHFFQALLAGRKRWSFFALEPERQRLLLARRRAFQVRENGPGRPRDTRWFELIGPDGSSATEALLQRAEAFRVEVVLEEGEVIFVPGGLPHQVSQIEPSLAVALNYVDRANLGGAVDKLLWGADFSRNQERRQMLEKLQAEPPVHSLEPEDLLFPALLAGSSPAAT